MISAFAGYQQFASISLQQGQSDNGVQQKSAPPGPRNVVGALQAHTDGARQAFDKAASQILTSFLDSLQNKISDEPVKGGNNAGTLTQLTSAEFESSLSVSASQSNGRGSAASLDLEAYTGLSFEMEEVDGQVVGFSLDFEMSTAFTFEGSNAAGGYQGISYENTQSFSISFSLEEGDDGSIISTLSFERSEVTQASYLSYGDQRGLGFGGGPASLNDIAGLFDGGGTQGLGAAPQGGESPLTAEATVDLEMEAALEIMKSIAENSRESLPSQFADSFYDNDF